MMFLIFGARNDSTWINLYRFFLGPYLPFVISSLSPTHSHTRTLPPTLPPSLAYTHTHSRMPTHSSTLSPSHSHSLSHTSSLSHSFTLSHSHSHSIRHCHWSISISPHTPLYSLPHTHTFPPSLTHLLSLF